MSSPGWYPDPERQGGWRWWDGTTWGPSGDNATPPPRPAPPQQTALNPVDRIDFAAPWARRLSKTIAIAAGIAATAAGGVIGYTALVGPFPGVPFVLVPGVPLLGIGQLWCISILMRRANDRRRASGKAVSSWPGTFMRPSDLRGGLPRPAAAMFLVLIYGVILLGAGGSIWGTVTGQPLGVPTDDPSSCEYSSNNHGDYRCLTKTEHDQEQARLQRFAASILAGFYVGHCGIATSEVLLRRQLGASQSR